MEGLESNAPVESSARAATGKAASVDSEKTTIAEASAVRILPELQERTALERPADRHTNATAWESNLRDPPPAAKSDVSHETPFPDVTQTPQSLPMVASRYPSNREAST